MPNENILIFAGHLGRDAETSSTPGGTQYTRFSLCSTKKWKQGDEWKEKQVWANVTAWKNDYAANLKKGDGVVVIGELDYNTWTDKQNVKHYDNPILAKSVLPIKKAEKKSNEPESRDELDRSEPTDQDLPF